MYDSYARLNRIRSPCTVLLRCRLHDVQSVVANISYSLMTKTSYFPATKIDCVGFGCVPFVPNIPCRTVRSAANYKSSCAALVDGL